MGGMGWDDMGWEWMGPGETGWDASNRPSNKPHHDKANIQPGLLNHADYITLLVHREAEAVPVGSVDAYQQNQDACGV